MSRYHVKVSGDGSFRMSGPSSERGGRVRCTGRLAEEAFSRYFTGTHADLIDVSMGVYTADRICARRSESRVQYPHVWHRAIELEVPVRDPGRWNRPEVAHRLGSVLSFLTDDAWEVTFVERTAAPRVRPGHLFDRRPEPPVTVALFSGGLDSFAGLCLDAQAKPGERFVLVTCRTSTAMVPRVELLEAGIRERFGPGVQSIAVPMRLSQPGTDEPRNEPTQRTRGLVFGLIGAAVARLAGVDELTCYENGVGALNLPLSARQLGAQHSRSAHPVALAEISDLIELVTDGPFTIHLPNQFSTKAQMCAGIHGQELLRLIPHTVSCDGFGRRVADEPVCGQCTSCLLRRQALRAAGLSRFDDSPGDLGDPSYELELMLEQVHRLRRALGEPDPWSGLAIGFPEVAYAAEADAARGGDLEDIRRQLVGLYEAYCGEWDLAAQGELILSPASTGGSP